MTESPVGMTCELQLGTIITSSHADYQADSCDASSGADEAA